MAQAFNIYCDESCHLEHDGIAPMLLCLSTQISVARVTKPPLNLGHKGHYYSKAGRTCLTSWIHQGYLSGEAYH